MPDRKLTVIHPEIQAVLGRLCCRIRWYVLLEGTAFVLVVVGVLFWVSLGLDYAYFRASNLELPRWFRMTIDVLVVCLISLTSVAWIGARLLRRFRTKALALILERRFPELDDRLVTAVESAESMTGKETNLTTVMLDRTINDVIESVRILELSDVFENRPIRRVVFLAAILVASIGGLAWANQEAVQRWKAGYLDLKHEYWPRDYGLIVKVITQPDDQIKNFRDLHYKHPRGDDLTLLLEVLEGKKIPDYVQIHYRMTSGTGNGRSTCTKVGDRRFKYSLVALSDNFEFRVTGGDFTSRLPYQVVIVDPPRVDRVVLENLYPLYTGLKKIDDKTGESIRDPAVVQSKQVSLPMETEFLMRVTTNKQLVRVRIHYHPFELKFGRMPASNVVQATLTTYSDEGKLQRRTELSSDGVSRFLASDGRSFTVPFVLSEETSQKSRDRISQIMTRYGAPLVMRPDMPIRIYLEDTDNIIGSDPARLTINGISDHPPIVETELVGIGASITRKAIVPVAGLISDDYGIVTARFDFTVNDEPDWQPWPFHNPPQDAPKVLPFQIAKNRPFERFEVLPLNLSIGQKLTLTVFAQDGDDLNGPHNTRGERYSFTIVSNEELLSILFHKELNLRRRFEQIISELKTIILDLNQNKHNLFLFRKGVDQGKQFTAVDLRPNGIVHEDKLKQIRTTLAACAARALHSIRKNANETAEVEASFQDVREELVNNAVHTPQILARLDSKIVRPLREINLKDYPNVDTELGLFKLTIDTVDDPTSRIVDSIDALTVLIAHMHRVLIEMRKLETFQETIETLKAIVEQEKEVKKQTKAKQKKKLLDQLKGDN